MNYGLLSAARRIRFWRTVQKSDGCWLWMGCLHKSGYAYITIAGKRIRVHRAAWELQFGPIPAGLHVLHACDVKRCVRGDHLFLGTHLDNMQDAARKGLMTGGSTPKLQPDALTQALALRQEGLTLHQIGLSLGVTRGRVWQMLHGWRYPNANTRSAA